MALTKALGDLKREFFVRILHLYFTLGYKPSINNLYKDPIYSVVTYARKKVTTTVT